MNVGRRECPSIKMEVNRGIPLWCQWRMGVGKKGQIEGAALKTVMRPLIISPCNFRISLKMQQHQLLR
jgi:hypothetical protein